MDTWSYISFTIWGIASTWGTCLLIDSAICAGYFVKELLCHSSGDVQSMLEKNENLYKLKSVERYAGYMAAACIPLQFPVAYICTTPYFCNLLADLICPATTRWRSASKLFFEYVICKLVIKGLNNLHKGIIPIKNYNIFALARIVREFTTLSVAFKTLLYVSFLNYLRAYNSTYVYYKAIKYSQYYQTGHYFAKYTVNEAVNIVNEFVDKKDWRALSDISVINALCTLIAYKIGQRRTAINFKLQLYKFYTCWNLIYVMQCVSWYINLLFFVLHMCLYFTWKTIFIWTVMSACLISGESAIVSSFLVMLTDVWLFVIWEANFFLRNLREMEAIMKRIDVEEFEVVD